jgi:NodT family efflux transporter outer membrane factor (OMF) lipoprotein
LAFTLIQNAGCTSCREYLQNGFKVGPNYCRPPAAVAPAWIDATDPEFRTSPTDSAAWWNVFQDPILDQLVCDTYRQNLSLRVAGLRILESQAQRAIAVGGLFPQTQQAFGSYARTGLSQNGPNAMASDMWFSEWQLGANLAWELDFWGRFRRAIESADANLDASVEQYDNVLVLLLSEVAQNYANVRIAEQRLYYAHKNVEIQRGSLRLAEERFRNGSTTRLDVTQGESNLAQTEATIPPLEANRREAANELCVLMAMPPQNMETVLGAEGKIPSPPPHVAVGVPAELLRRRPDIRRAERLVAAQSAMIGVATADLYPHLSITGTIYFDAEKFSDLFDAGSLAGSVGPGFRWDVLNYGRLVNNIRVQDARFQQLAVQYQDTVLQANKEAENAMIRFLKAQQQVRYLKQSVEAARQSVELVSLQYSEGKVDFNRVFNIQQTLTQQEDQLAVAQGSVVLNLIQLYKALGGGWQIRLGAPRQSAEVVPTPQPADAPTPAPMPAAPKPKA